MVTTEVEAEVEDPPLLVSASIEDGSHYAIILVFDKELNAGPLGLSKFVVRVNGTAVTVVSADASGTLVVIAVSTAIVSGDVVTVTYNPGVSGSRIVDTLGNFTSTFSNQPVVNNLVP